MPTVGRNAPCPCGSGRKYKQCCLPREQADRARTISVRREDEVLFARLVAYTQRPAFFGDQEAAFNRFWNGDFGLEALEVTRREDMLPFLEWLVYDYRTSKDKQRIIDLFIAEEETHLTPEQRVILAEREAAYLSVYGIETADPGGTLEVGDLLIGGFHRVQDVGLARLALPGDLLLGRRFGDEVNGRMSRGTVLLPATLGPGLTAAAKRAFTAYRDEHYQATWGEFLREAGVILYHYLTTPEAGEAYERAPQREQYYDPRTTVEAMRRIAEQRAEEDAREAAEAEAKRMEEEEGGLTTPPVEVTSGGILIPGQPKPAAGSERRILLPDDLLK